MSERCETCGQQTEYNGWPNYETWCVNLWLANDAGEYAHVRAHARAILESPLTVEGFPVSPEFRLAEWLQEHVEGCAPDIPASVYSDLMASALGCVEWRVIALSWLEDEAERLRDP